MINSEMWEELNVKNVSKTIKLDSSFYLPLIQWLVQSRTVGWLPAGEMQKKSASIILTQKTSGCRVPPESSTLEGNVLTY